MAEPRKSFPLRISGALFEELRRWAEQDMRSVNGQIEFLLREAVQRRGRKIAAEQEEPTEETECKELPKHHGG